MTDKPKAAHFDAFVNGKRLADHDPVGLEIRWAAAANVERDVSANLLESGAMDRAAEYAKHLFKGTSVSVRLRIPAATP